MNVWAVAPIDEVLNESDTQLHSRSLNDSPETAHKHTNQALADKKPNLPFQLLLAGGALSTCSSYSKHHCQDNTAFVNAKTGLLYELSPAAFSRLATFIQSAPDGKYSALNNIIATLSKQAQKSPLSRRELFAIFDQLELTDAVDNLHDGAYFALLDHLEYAQFEPEPERKPEPKPEQKTNAKERLKEQANVKATNNSHSQAIYQRFVKEVNTIAAARGQQPQILVATSSSRDAFEVVDFYRSVFNSLGVKTLWLPIDASLAYALSAKAFNHLWADDICEQLDSIRQKHHVFDRERVYPDLVAQQKTMCEQPELLKALIAGSQGLFFNGGDQSKTLASLLNSDQQALPFWREVIEKVGRYEMIVGGTSAGTAVHAGTSFNAKTLPMISNGSSENAIKRGAFAHSSPSQRCSVSPCEQQSAIKPNDLTYMPSGGSGLFGVGTLDTHFSERNREGRLVALVAKTGARLGVGVDETTALLYRVQTKNAQSNEPNTIDLEVIGKHGVFIVDGFEQKQSISYNKGRRSSQYTGVSHYLFSGNALSVDLSSTQWHIPEGALQESSALNIPNLEQGEWRNKTRRACANSLNTYWVLDDVEYALTADNKTQFFTDGESSQCGYIYLPYSVSFQP
ncbi:cyanophycinase [Glaciecola siphonariae]|uniref:Cyanophycinase n=1 Tax=Glaciecola siphonariae TaxID=521012 RepID=A0ABV9LY68_9ALTE